MENVTQCCMIGCETDSSISKYFFGFPSDFNLCMLWVQNSGKPEHFEDFAFGGAEPFLNRHICSDHFYDEDFVDADDKSLGLLPDSVPQLNLPASQVDIKEECLGPEYTAALKITSNSEFPIQIKLESPEPNDVNGNFSFSYSNDDSGNDFHTNRDPLDETDAEEIKLSDDFFRDYNDAMRRNRRRGNESERARLKRLKREAMKAKERRSKESEEQSRLRRMKNALRAAFRRKNETPEQREARRMKDNTRALMKRNAETEIEASIRRHNDAVRAANRRKNETSEEKRSRRMKDTLRAAKRRSMETPEQRQMRLSKDRERASKKRMFKKIFEQMEHLSDANDVFPSPPTYVDVKDDGVEYETDDTTPITIPSLPSAMRQCPPGSSYERLQEVLNFVSKRVRFKGRSNIVSSNDSKSFSAVEVEAREDNTNGDDHDVYTPDGSHFQHNIQNFLSWNKVNQQTVIEERVPEDSSKNASIVQSVQQQCSMDKNPTVDETEVNGDLR